MDYDEKLAAIRLRAKQERIERERGAQEVYQPQVDQEVPVPERERRIETYVQSEQKSPAAGLLLAILLGPIGYLYVSPLSGAIIILVAIGVTMIWIPLVLLPWLLCIIAAPFEVMSYNKKLRAKAELIAGS